MAGLVVIFNPDRVTVPIDELAAGFPTHAARRDEWRDSHCAVVRLHHGMLNGAAQPHWNESQTVALFSDGEIFADDAPDEANGAGTEIGPKTWLHLFEAGRMDAFSALNGSFALVLYDAERRRLSLISDRHGSRPLYYFVAGSEIVVASQIAALTAHPRCPKRLDRQALHELVACQRVLGHGTIYSGIHRLEPATMLQFDGRSVRAQRYWDLRWRPPAFSRQEAPALLADRIVDAVRRRLRPKLRYGLLLSGGLDSRAILAASEQPPICFTQAAQETEEVGITRQVACLKGAEFHFLPVDPPQYHEHFEEAVRLTGGMQRAHASHFLPSLATIKQHCDVLLVGYGFDAIYRGREMPARHLKLGRHALPLPKLRKVGPDGLIATILRSASYALPESSVRQVLAQEASREHDARLEGAAEDVLGDFDWSDDEAIYNAWDYLSLRSIGQDDAYPNVLCIRSWMDDRVPAFDHDLFEIYRQMPPNWRYPEAIYIAALRRLLPRPLAKLEIADTGLPAEFNAHLATPIRKIRNAWRLRSTEPKRRHSWPNFGTLLCQHPAFRKRLLAMPYSDAMAACEIFDPAGLETVVSQHLEGERNHSKLLLMLLTIESWIDQFGADGVA